MISENMVPQLVGDEVFDRAGDKIGRVGQVYLDDRTGQPVWATVRTGLFGMKESFVPLASARVERDELWVAATKEQVKEAPRLDAAGKLSEEETQRLYQYYGMPYPSVPGPRGEAPQNHDGQRMQRQNRSDQPSTTDDAMTRSEERLKVDTEQVETGKVRLRKYVVTEEQQVTIPVRHEEVRIEREPITEANRQQAMAGPEISEAEHEVTLHAERPVVKTEAVPMERVRLNTETVTEETAVSGQVRKERIEVTDDAGRNKR